MARTKAITDVQLDLLCKTLPWRDSLAMRIMRATGLRVSDVLALKKADLANTMTVREIKTGKSRTITIPSALLKEMQLYASLHKGSRLIIAHRSTIYRSVHKRALQLGWPCISAHSARKAYARAYARTHSLRATQKEMQHSTLGTTLLYLHDD